MTDLERNIAVVGGGYAGLSAALVLRRAGVRVTVFESGRIPGGRARRVEVGGRALDNGQHILSGAYSTLLGLMREAGVPDSVLLRRPLELRYAGGAGIRASRLPGSFGPLASLLGARGIPLRERLGALRFIAGLGHEEPVDPTRTVSELLDSAGQSGEIGRYLWRPLCVSALNTPADTASARVFARVLRETLAGGTRASDLLYPLVDLSALFPEPASRVLDASGGSLRLGTTVSGIESGADGVRIGTERFQGAIIAVGPHQLRPFKALLRGSFEPAYQPIYTIYLQYPPAAALGTPMLGLDRGLVQWVFDRGLLLGTPGLLACVISARGEHQQMTHDELAVACHRELKTVIPGLASPSWSQVIAEKRATISCVAGWQPPGIETRSPRVFLAGDYTDPDYPPTLEAAARSGVRAAERLLEAIRLP